MRWNYPRFVKAGLDPAIHVLLLPIQRKKDVDARDIPGKNALRASARP
ncbi:hypothetical protein V1279_006644 [Bradyrhizobium sp. AZCC 1610]